jgi:transcriptional regulator of acetoin/glycerol metabolism
MVTLEPHSTKTLAAWEQFVHEGQLDHEALRPEIARAWLRCRDAGVDPFRGRSTRSLDAKEIRQMLLKRKNLIDVALPFMKSLYQFVASTTFVVVLCDERGYLMETVGALDAINRAREISTNFLQGSLWAEEEIGNNGVGTSLFLQRPFQIIGEEHYCRQEHLWTCSGAPIFNETGQIVGVLEISAPAAATHEHTLGMVVAAAGGIQQQLSVHFRNRELMLLNAHLNNLFKAVSDGVIVLDAAGVIQQANPVAVKAFKDTRSELVGAAFARYVDHPGPVLRMLESGQAFSDLELTVSALPAQPSFLVSGKPIKDEQGNITSGVLFLNPIKKINTLINRFSGAHATFTFDDIIGQGPALTKAVQRGIQAAASTCIVLLRGESGTGKEMFAHAIHNHSDRAAGPFIAINCGAIPRDLLASELFGYQEGAFTGAHKGGRPGKFELAAGGTLFLDEIGDMPLDQQVALLRVLQDSAVTRLGGDRSFVMDVRIICATHKNLHDEVLRGAFREDLFYRLHVMPIRLPSLREHPEDIPLLLQAFLVKHGPKPTPPVAPAVIPALQAYAWPGNVREFENAVERILQDSRGGPIRPEHLPEEIQAPLPAAEPLRPPARPQAPMGRKDLQEHLDQQARVEILEALQHSRGNVSQAAQALGLSRNALYRKLTRLGIR